MTYQISDSERQRILGLHGINPDENYLKQRLAECKFTKDGKYVLFENNIYSSETGELIPLTEKWTLSDTFHTIGDLASAGLDFVFPGSGAIIDTLNAISYIIEAQFKSDPKEKRMLYVMATITFAFVIVPGALQTSITPLKIFLKTGKGAEKAVVQKGIKLVPKFIDKIVLGIPRMVSKALQSPLAKKLLGKFGIVKIGKIIDNFILAIKTSVDDIFGVVAKEGVKVGGKTATKATVKGAAKVGSKTLLKTEKFSMIKFFQKTAQGIRGKYVMKKFGFAAGKEYGYIIKAGTSGQRVTIIKGMSDGVVVKNVLGGNSYFVPITQFLRGTVGAPWAHKGYSEAVPFFIKMFARSILPDGSGLNYAEMDAMPDLNPDQTSLESLAYLRDELAAYEGNMGAYSVNTTVTAFQEGLIALGYPLSRFGVDGKFGPETQDALKQFQLDAKLESSQGKMDRLTADKLALELRARGIPGSEELQNTLNSI